MSDMRDFARPTTTSGSRIAEALARGLSRHASSLFTYGALVEGATAAAGLVAPLVSFFAGAFFGASSPESSSAAKKFADCGDH